MTESYYITVIQPLICNSDVIDIINFLRQMRVLKYSINCEDCDLCLIQVKKLDSLDKYAFRCAKKECKKYKNHISIRKGSFLEELRTPLDRFVHFIYLFSMDMNQTTMSSMVGVSIRNIQKLIGMIRERIVKYFRINKPSLGGPGVIVQIDESKFNYNTKAHRGRGPVEPVWVFGLVDTSFKPAKGVMRIVERRNKDTLLSIICEVVRPGTIIHSDEWKAYTDLNQLGFEHGTVCHKYNFINPENGVHTQNIESYWNRQKLRIKKSKGAKKSALNALLSEFMFRDYFCNNLFENIFIHLLNYNN